MQFETKKRNEKYAKKGKKRNETNKMLQCLTVSIQTRMQNIVE